MDPHRNPAPRDVRRCRACHGTGERLDLARVELVRCVVCAGAGSISFTDSTSLIVQSRRERFRPGPIALTVVLRQEVAGGPMEVVDAWEAPLRCTATVDETELELVEVVVEEAAHVG